MADPSATTELPLGAGATGECIIGDRCSGLGGDCPEPVRCSIDWLFAHHGLGNQASVVVRQHPYRTVPKNRRCGDHGLGPKVAPWCDLPSGHGGPHNGTEAPQ